MERLEALKETLTIIKQKKAELNAQRREALNTFISSHITEGWVRLEIEDYISYGEYMRGGSDYLVDEETFEMFLSTLVERICSASIKDVLLISIGSTFFLYWSYSLSLPQ